MLQRGALFWGMVLLCSMAAARAADSYKTQGHTYELYNARRQMYELRKEPAIRAALDMLAHAEVGDLGPGGYQRAYGRPSSYLVSLEKHPATVVCSYLGGKRVCATAAGRYQFLKRTWDVEIAELGLRDFSPLSQDLAAIHQLVKVGAIDDIRRQNLAGFFDKACIVWATLPGSPYGQPTKSYRDLERVFKRQYAFYRRRAGYV